MTAHNSRRLFDVRTASRLSLIHAHSLELGYRITLDFDCYRSTSTQWIVQLYDQAEREILTGRGGELAEAVAELYDRLLSRTS